MLIRTVDAADKEVLEKHEMQTFENVHSTRGIPGVTSDAYHLGYFEDSTSQRSVPPVHTRFDGLIESLYIFGIAVLIYILITLILFGIREYTLSLKKRKLEQKSRGSIWTLNTANSPLSLQSASSPARIIDAVHRQNPAYPSLPNLQDQVSSVQQSPNLHDRITREVSVISSLNHTNRLTKDAKAAARAKAGHRNNDSYSPFNIIKISPDQEMSSESFEELIKEQKRILQSSRTKRVYTIVDLMKFKPSEYFGVPIIRLAEANPTRKTIEEIVSSSVRFQHVDFKSSWNAEKAITEIRCFLKNRLVYLTSDIVTKRITAFRLIVIGSNASKMTNANIFLPSFSKTMDELIDSGRVFDILLDNNIYMAKNLVEMIIEYCYAHWLFSKSKDRRITDKFLEWNAGRPFIQSNEAVCRYLVNILLGLHSVDNLDRDTMKFLQNKVRRLLQLLISNSTCQRGQTELLSLLSQAIEFSLNWHIRLSFYHFVKLLVLKHSDCCLKEMCTDNRQYLKNLIQFGLSPESNQPIKNVSKDIYDTIVSKLPRVELLWDKPHDEIRTPKRDSYRYSSDRSRERERSRTPGSWKSR